MDESVYDHHILLDKINKKLDYSVFLKSEDEIWRKHTCMLS